MNHIALGTCLIGTCLIGRRGEETLQGEWALRETQTHHVALMKESRCTPRTLLLATLAFVAILGAFGCGAAAASAGLEGDYLGLRNTVGMSPPTSMECYTFYPDGSVELRHNGATAPTDSGSYQGDANEGQVVWNSGRTSYVISEGGSLRINDTEVKPIDSCLSMG